MDPYLNPIVLRVDSVLGTVWDAENKNAHKKTDARGYERRCIVMHFLSYWKNEGGF